MKDFESVAALIESGEGQLVEFKESTRLASKEGAQALVGFANAQGGQVFFGVTNKGQTIGEKLGPDSIEKLVGHLEEHIYPSLPFEVEVFPVGDGDRNIVSVSAPHDVPPIIGAYLYVSRAINYTTNVDSTAVQAFRRIGKRTQKVDFMWLRGHLSSDPVVLIDCRVEPQNNGQLILECVAWLVSGTGPAYDIQVSTDPPFSTVVRIARDLPASDGKRDVRVNLGLNLPDPKPHKLHLVASYQDDWGCLWQSRRSLKVINEVRGGLQPTSEVTRRIVAFPPKSLASPVD